MEDSSSNELMNENQTVALHGEVCGVAWPMNHSSIGVYMGGVDGLGLSVIESEAVIRREKTNAYLSLFRYSGVRTILKAKAK